MFDVITVGSATVDVYLKVHSELIKIRDEQGENELIAYPAGSKLLVKTMEFHIGGGGTNTAVAFSRLGLKTGYMGCVGTDAHGREVMTLLRKEKIKFLGKRSKKATGYSAIFDSIEGDRTVLAYKGCNDDLKLSSLDVNKLKTKSFYLASMTGESYEVLKKIAKFAEENQIYVAFNPSSYLAKKGINYLRPIMNATDDIILNKEEAELLAGRTTIQNMLKILATNVKKIVVITDGKKGVWIYDKKKIYHAKPNRIKIVEPTGAGDAFGSSFVAARLKGKEIKTALKWGMTNAESVIQHFGAKDILLNKKQIGAKLRKTRIKIDVRVIM